MVLGRHITRPHDAMKAPTRSDYLLYARVQSLKREPAESLTLIPMVIAVMVVAVMVIAVMVIAVMVIAVMVIICRSRHRRKRAEQQT
jgi:Flp pilus assembly protein TadB